MSAIAPSVPPGFAHRPPSRRRNTVLHLLRVRDWRVRTKLAAVATVPAVAFLVVAGVQAGSSVRQATAMDQFAREVRLAHQVTAVVHELQRERDKTAGVLAAAVAGTPRSTAPAADGDLGGARQSVDNAVDAFRTAAQPLLGKGLPRDAYDRANSGIADLTQVRAGVQGGWLRQQAVFDTYSHSIAELLALLPTPDAVTGDAALAQTIQAVGDLARAKELTAQVRGRLFAACVAKRFVAQEFDALTDTRAQRQAALDAFRAGATGPQVARFDEVVHGPAVRTADTFERGATQHPRTEIGVDPAQWWQAATAQLDLMRTVERNLLDEAVSGAQARVANQWRHTAVVSAIVAAILFVATLASWLIGRSVARSLRILREQALDVAQHRLPEAIEQLRTTPHGPASFDTGSVHVRSADEIGEVAEAFTAVHRSAVRLAGEQAMMRRAVNAMFVNLARRSQSLVERQLQLLDTLEAGETDPEQLGVLFRLDHLATRMRRNDENLLVLAGSESSRRWPEPVALSAVVLAAMAEIDQYPRIRHDVAENVYVVGHAVADLVHLLAELLENATAFSPPDTLVNVTGWRSTDAPGAIVMIQDHGMGMTASGVAEANRRLASPTAIDVAASERMGLVVVGHLAARHRIRVELRAAPDGVLGQVWLPGQLLAGPPSGVVEGRPAPAALTAPPGRISPIVRRSIASLAPGPTARPAPAADPAANGAAPAAEGAAGSAAPVQVALNPALPAPGAGSTTGPVAGNGMSLSRRAAAPAVVASGRSTRAEDVLGAEKAAGPAESGPTNGDDTASRWWSRSGTVNATAPRVPTQRQPVNAGTSGAGLPIRVPMAQLPGDDTGALPIVTVPVQTQPPVVVDAEPDPSHVGSMLSRFYSGVHRATAEAEPPAES